MPMLGQASGGWSESSSALRILNVGIRNSIGVLTDDSFTQSNPPSVTTQVSDKVDTTRLGVLSGSVAFTRPDAGSNFVGGPGDLAAIAADATEAIGYKALGLFINAAQGNAFENTPGVASGVGPYVCAMGTYGNALYETLMQVTAAGFAAGTPHVWYTGVALISSVNGYIMPRDQLVGGVVTSLDIASTCAAESFVTAVNGTSTLLGVLKMPPDSVQNEIVFDLRV